MTHIAFAGTFSRSLETRVRAHLRMPCDVTVADEDDVVAKLADVDVLVSMAFTREMGAAAGRLKLVQVPGAGLDRVDRTALPAGAWLANAYGHETGIAEYVLGAMLALTRDFVRLDASLRRGVWESQWAVGVAPPPTWPELAGRSVGIVGYGRIGQALARRARAFDMRVLAIRRDVRQSSADDLELLGGPEMLDEVLQRADYIVLTLPLSGATRGLIGPARLGLMKPTAMLINVSRAEIVDEAALYWALAERRIAAAALDVWYRYPTEAAPIIPAHHPFHELPNVLMTPHVSGWTAGMLENRAKLIADNISRTTRGEPPLNHIPTAACAEAPRLPPP
jgi:phosphoglycerate dehydrogenase-like enzyme